MTLLKTDAGLDNRRRGGYNLKRKGREKINPDTRSTHREEPLG